jgi:hypothetical protein
MVEHNTVPRENVCEQLTTWMHQTATHAPKTCLLTIPEGLVIIDDVHRAVKEANMESVCIDMNGLQGIDLYAASRSPIAVTFRRKIIVVFDYDAIVSSNQAFVSHITNAIKLDIVPVLLVAQEMTGKVATLPVKTYQDIRVAPPPPDETPAATEKEDEYKITIIYSKKDQYEDKGLLGAKYALEGRTDIDYRGDNIAFGGVYDSYLAACPDDRAHLIAEAYSWADVMGDAMFGGDDMYSFFPLTTTATVFANARKKGKVKTFGVVWSKNNARFARLKNINQIRRSMLESGNMTLLSLCDGLDSCRTLLTQCVHAKDYKKTGDVARSFGLTPQTLLLLMRLWNTKYTVSIHAKVKQHMV